MILMGCFARRITPIRSKYEGGRILLRYFKSKPGIAIIGVFILTLACTIFSTPTAESQTQKTGTNIPISVEDYPLETLPPPLDSVKFPDQEVDYPSDWPPEFRYPHQYIAVELSSGSFPGSESFALSAKLRFEGEPEIAAEGLASYFIQNGWEIDELVKLDNGAVVVELTNKTGSSGIIIVDSDVDNAKLSNIIAFIIP